MANEEKTASRRTAVKAIGATVVGSVGVAVGSSTAAAGDTFNIVTLDPGALADTAARFEGKMESLPDGEKATHYFEWGKEGEGLPNTTDVDGPRGINEGDTFTEWMFNLEKNTTYEYRAVGETTISETVDTGDMVTFTTKKK
jgi:hypothetical protein